MGMAKQAVERYLEAIDLKNSSALRALYADEARVFRPGGGEMTPDALIPFNRVFVEAMPDYQHQLVTLVEEGASAAFEAVITATFTGPLQTPNGPVPANGRRLNLREAGFIRVDPGGKIVVDRSYVDQVEMLTQLGLMPGPAGA